VPVISLTRRGDLKSKLAAFERGVDEILTVPFSPEEFVARVLALMRRTYRDNVMFTPAIRLGDLEIDIVNRRVRAHDTELHLTSLEQSLLYLLVANAGRVFTQMRFWTISGVPTMLPKATSWTGTSATCASSCRTIRDCHDTSPRFRAAATVSGRPSPTRQRLRRRSESLTFPHVICPS
jgi:CheY-like chemotaxis protein